MTPQPLELKKVIVDQQEEVESLLEQEEIIERELDSRKLRGFLKHPNVLVISGVRRSGKSILSLLLSRGEKYGYLNFDDERLVGFTEKDFNRLLQAFYELYGEELEYFVFDEIQNIPHWQVFINRLRRTKKIIVTGSNARLLSGELSTVLTGRYLDFTLYPFSFREFLRYKKAEPKTTDAYSTKKTAELKRRLAEYLQLGGFPEVFKFGKSINQRIYGDILMRDILFRYKIRHKKSFKELANYLLTNFSREFSYSKLQKVFALKDVHTVKNYLDHLVSSFLFITLEKFSFKLKEQVIAPKKVYSIDPGLINALSFQFSPNLGPIAENAVLLELLRKRSYGEEDFDVYFWKDYRQREVDFVIKKDKRVQQLIQVCCQFTGPETKERELKSLVEAGRELRCDNLLVITDDLEGEEVCKGKQIRFVPLWRWLLT
ncbi:MAG: ATP-binding protein [Deltaproteobacteria bacterium]|nr:ATP-binding protein [Deltaproteobacteria bacterium]